MRAVGSAPPLALAAKRMEPRVMDPHPAPGTMAPTCGKTAMKLAFVISHPSPDIGGEVREVALAAVLRRCGIDAQVFRMSRGNDTVQDHPFGAPILLCKADDPDAADNALYSNRMLASLKYFEPHIIVIKGFGYQMNETVVQEFKSVSPLTPLIGILGGRWRDDSLKSCAAVFYEFEEQRSQFADFTGSATQHAILPKYINWLHINSRTTSATVREIDMIIVGSLIERKKLDLLVNVPSHINVCVVGDGPLRIKLQEILRDKKNIILLGAKPNEEALDLLNRSKLLLHCSDDEGLPRVFGEALACGTPNICSDRLRCGADFPKECVVQAGSNQLIELAVDKLENKPWLEKAQLLGRNYIQQNHSFYKMFLLFSNSLKQLHPPVGALLP
jgi:glycosyltransferase involved in cell wall biosynthesis